ncbi:unnamed protein product [Linum trigynum]|uniref:Uncharacterized protein n=1 Tax=Linum trigynum TaxID=586398 RepID=A0AAV2CXP9_9ROSI
MPNPPSVLRGRESLKTRHLEGRARSKTHRGTWVIQNATTKRNAQPAIRPEGQGLAQNTSSQRQSEILKRIAGLWPFKKLPRNGIPIPPSVLRSRDSLETCHPKGRAMPQKHYDTTPYEIRKRKKRE